MGSLDLNFGVHGVCRYIRTRGLTRTRPTGRVGYAQSNHGYGHTDGIVNVNFFEFLGLQCYCYT